MTLSYDLHKLEELRARGALTDEEFARAKERLLNEGKRQPFSAVRVGAQYLPPQPHRPLDRACAAAWAA